MCIRDSTNPNLIPIRNARAVQTSAGSEKVKAGKEKITRGQTGNMLQELKGKTQPTPLPIIHRPMQSVIKKLITFDGVSYDSRTKFGLFNGRR